MIDSKTPLSNTQIPDQSHPDEVAEAYADRLMNELFDGVERALEGDSEALQTLVQETATEMDLAKSASAELTLSFTEGGLPPVLLSARDRAPLSLTMPADLGTKVLTTASPKSWKQAWKLNWALLGATGLTLLATLGLWLYQRQQAATMMVTSGSSAIAPSTTGDLEFIEYLRRSLEVISRTTGDTAIANTPIGVPNVGVSSPSNVVTLPTISNGALPTQPLPGGPVAVAPNSVSVIERVYIPYPASPSGAAPSAVTPSTTSSPGPTIATAPSPAVMTVQHKLVGVLELGDRSAALFEVDGVPQRIYIGERIATSGWSLVSVSNNEVVIRRNGEVRTLYIGQQF
jgi:hypothetical protein